MALTAESNWTDERLEEALDTLKEMYIMCRELRSTIPSMVQPLASRHPGPEALLQEFVKAATDAKKKTTAFQQMMQTDASKSVLEKAADIRQKSSGEAPLWRASEHSDWFLRDEPKPIEASLETETANSTKTPSAEAKDSSKKPS